MKKLSTTHRYSLAPILLIVTLLAACHTDNHEAGSDWPVYLGGNSTNQYSPLQQITVENVQNLKPAWVFHCGDDVSGNDTQIQCNPLIINGVLYGTSPKLRVFALDASDGHQLWAFNPHPDVDFAMNVNRGLAYWKKGNDSRILFTAGPLLYALNAESGKPVLTFGDSGHVSLKEGLGDHAEDKYVVATSPGIVYKNLLVIGSRVTEASGAAPGYIRAFNILTGNLEWVFHTIPLPGEDGYETWPDSAFAYAGGANSWAGMSLDEKRGIVYIPTGSPAFDFWGGDRKGKNLYANCILALNASDGSLVWYFQTVHHDLWDRDVPTPPDLVTVHHNGREIQAVAQITKSGFVFLFDRSTGEPVFPIREIPVPPSDLDGEETWPVQPVPDLPPPFSPQILTMDNITDISDSSHDFVAGILKNVHTGRQFIPPSTDGTVVLPGFDGGGEWGGAAVDPASGILYVNGSVMPWIITMLKIDTTTAMLAQPGRNLYMVNCAVCHGQNREGLPGNVYPALTDIGKKYNKEEIIKLLNSGKGFMPAFQNLHKDEKLSIIAFITGEAPVTDLKETSRDTKTPLIPYTHTGYNRFVDQQGYPAIKPPWGIISAIDLNKGDILWQVPLGEFKELTDRGIPITGTENYGGPVVTAGGLIFIAASKDGYIRAFNKDNGKECWKYKLPSGGYATPAVYKVNGRQYVVIACGGGKMGTPSGDTYMAFALP